MRFHFSILFALLDLSIVQVSAAAEPLTLEAAVDQALQHAHSLRLQQARLDKARFERHASLAALGPRVNLSADWQRWDSALKFAFETPDPSTIPPEFAWVTSLFGSGESVIRARNTWSASVAVVQPITGLAPLSLASHLAGLAVDHAALETSRERRRVRLQAIETFLAVWKAHRGVAVLDGLLQAATGHLRQAQEAERVGLLKKDDVLRIEVQVANLEQARDLARMGLEVQRSSLALMLGRPLDAELEVVEPPGDAGEPPPLQTCLDQAIQTREETRQVRLAVRMAETARSLQGTSWLPQVSGIFSYNRATQTQFSKPDSWFLGVSVQWNAWDWGQNFLKFRAADAEVEMSRRAAAQVEDLVRLEVKAQWLALQNARQQIVRSDQSVLQARENLRIQLERSRQGLNTTTDVLDAEAVALQAETAALDARHDAWLAWERLRDTLGGRWP